MNEHTRASHSWNKVFSSTRSPYSIVTRQMCLSQCELFIDILGFTGPQPKPLIRFRCVKAQRLLNAKGNFGLFSGEGCQKCEVENGFSGFEDSYYAMKRQHGMRVGLDKTHRWVPLQQASMLHSMTRPLRSHLCTSLQTVCRFAKGVKIGTRIWFVTQSNELECN